MTDKVWGDLLLMIGFGSGLYWFGDGFRIFREYRLLANTPLSRIRSLAMGRVEIQGIATGEKTLSSPLTRTPCFVYQVKIEKWESGRGRGRWSHYWTDIRTVNFYIDDGTGKVLVDPGGAEYDLGRRRMREIGRQRGLLEVLLGSQPGQQIGSEATDADLAEYVSIARAGATPLNVLHGNNLANPTDTANAGSGLAVGGGIYQKVWNLAETLDSTGRFRLSEYCIVPNNLYDVTGTCVGNPNPKDESDRNLICKGENEPIFLISWRDEKGVENALRNKAVLRIFGGAALAICCLYLFFVLVRIGWL
jgi:hypothetical protein